MSIKIDDRLFLITYNLYRKAVWGAYVAAFELEPHWRIDVLANGDISHPLFPGEKVTCNHSADITCNKCFVITSIYGWDASSIPGMSLDKYRSGVYNITDNTYLPNKYSSFEKQMLEWLDRDMSRLYPIIRRWILKKEEQKWI